MLKRLLPIFVSFGFFAIFSFVFAADTQAANFYISPATGSVQNGNNITLTVRLNTQGVSTAIADLGLTYDQTKLEFVSYSNAGSPLSTAFGLSAGNGSLFVTQYIAPPPTPTTGDILYGTVIFKALAGSGTTPVSIVTSGTGKSLMFSYEDIDGQPVGSPAGGDPLDGQNGRPSTTGTGGTYTLTSPPAPPPPGGGTPPPPGGGTPPPPGGSTPPPPSGSTPPPSGSTTPPSSGSTTPPSSSGSESETQTVPNTFGDNKVPTISNIKITNITESSVAIEWTTDEESTSYVNYGTTTAYGFGEGDANYTKNHKLTITRGLDPSTDYNFQVFSSDYAGNTAYSKNQEFRTKPPVSVQRTYRYIGLAMIIGGLLALGVIAFYYFRKKGPHPDNLMPSGPSANLNPPI